MSTTQPPRAMVRIDEDLHEQLRIQAFHRRTNVTRLVNQLLRAGMPLAEAGIFNHPVNDVLAALDTLAKEKEQAS